MCHLSTEDLNCVNRLKVRIVHVCGPIKSRKVPRLVAIPDYLVDTAPQYSYHPTANELIFQGALAPPSLTRSAEGVYGELIY